MLGRDVYLDKYRKELEGEARWLEFGATMKASSIETLLRRNGVKPRTLLELGSGTCAVIRECQRRGLAEKYIAIDASEEATQWARERSPGIHCIVADIASPSFEFPEGVDVVVLSHVLEHLENPQGFLATLVAQMSFTWLIAEVPLEDLIAARLKNLFRDRTANSAGHVQFFTQKSFRALVGSTGLEVVDSLRYAPVVSADVLEWMIGRTSVSATGRLVKRMTQRYLPGLLGPAWSRFYHAHLAVLCRVAEGAPRS